MVTMFMPSLKMSQYFACHSIVQLRSVLNVRRFRNFVLSDLVRVLRATIAYNLSMDVHVAHVCSQSFYMLRQLRRVRQSLVADSANTFVHAFVMSHMPL